MKKLLIIAGHDSYIKGSLNISETFQKHGYRVEYYIYHDHCALDQKHLQELGFENLYKSGLLNEVFRIKDIFQFDAIMPYMERTSIYNFIELFNKKVLSSKRSKRPILFSGYCGIVYENHVQGFLDRQGLDILYVNSQHDLMLFRSYCLKLNLDYDNIVLTGLPMLDTAYHKRNDKLITYNAILFAGQPTVPQKIQERIYIVKKLIEYAEKFPSKKVFFKPRHKPHQSTFHTVMFHYHDIINYCKKRMSIPDNFILTYDPIQDLLQKVDLCLTVSSTASFEALCMGNKVGFMADFGIAEKFGNHYFMGSDCLVTFNDLMFNRNLQINEDWKNTYFKCDGKNTERLFSAVEDLVEKQNASMKMLPIRQSFKSQLSQDFNFMPEKSKKRYFFTGRMIEKLIVLSSRVLSKAGPTLFMKIFPG